MEDKRENTTSYSRYLIWILCIAFLLCFVVALLNYIVDPYFHYHKPYTNYRLADERYINDGIARNFDYDAIIIGNSLSENFKCSQYDALFDVKSVKLPYSGSGVKELWDALGHMIGRKPLSEDAYNHIAETQPEYIDDYKALDGYGKDIKEVLICVDIDDIDRYYSWHRYNEYPDYLYDDIWWNDINYLLNKDTLYRGTVYNLGMTIAGKESTSFDEYASWTRESGPKQALGDLDYIDENINGMDRSFEEKDAARVCYNIKCNVLPVIEANPNVRFRFLVAPISIAKWAEYRSDGKTGYIVDVVKCFSDMLLEYNNVEIYSFLDSYDVINDLDRYCDSIHYDAGVSEWMLDEISMGNHNVNTDNMMRYYDDLKAYLTSYDYVSLNDYLDSQ